MPVLLSLMKRETVQTNQVTHMTEDLFIIKGDNYVVSLRNYDRILHYTQSALQMLLQVIGSHNLPPHSSIVFSKIMWKQVTLEPYPIPTLVSMILLVCIK